MLLAWEQLKYSSTTYVCRQLHTISHSSSYILIISMCLLIANVSFAAPTSAPTNFHVVVINSTAIEVEWDLPPLYSRGGIIRGYKLFVQRANGGLEEKLINIPDNETEGYIVGGLSPATSYRFSAVAYTSAGDSPRTISLTIATLSERNS